MLKLFILSIFYLSILSTLSNAQRLKSEGSHKNKGLELTEEILNELSLPEWLWGGAHIYENVEDQHHLVEGELLEKYFSLLSVTGLNDPQKILSTDQQQAIVDLISNHEQRSQLEISYNILAPEQKLDLSEEEIQQRLENLYKNKNAIIVYYYYGYPRETTGYVITAKLGIVKSWEVDELFLNSTRDAGIQIEKFNQMEHFLKELSKRSFWLEKKLIIPQIVVPPANNKSDLDQENTSEMDAWTAILAENIFTLVLMLCVLVIGLWYFLWSTKWRKYVLPLQNSATRLGADYGANVSNTIEFSNPKSSLTEQYEKLQNREL